MKIVTEFISDGESVEVSMDLKNTASHVVTGNNMRLDQADSIRYDYRWFNNSTINFCYAIFPGIKKMNQEYVYKNVDHFFKKETRFRPPSHS